MTLLVAKIFFFRMDDWEAEVVKKDPWEGEDDNIDETVKDSWDVEDEPVEKPRPKPMPPAIKKDVKIPQAVRDLTKEERDKEVQAADLENAMELFGIKGVDAREVVGAVKDKSQPIPQPVSDAISLGAKDPISIPEFEALAKKLAFHLNQKFSSNQNFPLFLETLIRQTMSEREASELRKISSILNDLANSKSKRPAAKKKAALITSHKKGNDIDFEDYGDVYDENE